MWRGVYLDGIRTHTRDRVRRMFQFQPVESNAIASFGAGIKAYKGVKEKGRKIERTQPHSQWDKT